MNTMRLTLIGVALLLVGVVLLLYGFSMAPTVGQSIGNVFHGAYTDKPNILKFGGLALAATGSAMFAGGAIGALRSTSA